MQTDDNAPRDGSPKAGLPAHFIVLGVVVLMGFSLSLAALTWWLIARPPANPNATTTRGVQTEAADLETTSGESIEIFNGRDLAGWDFDSVVWDVRNGVIHGSKTRSGGLVWRGGEVEDFELRFRFRLVRGNSGVYYRARPLPNYGVGGYEFEIYTNRVGELSDNGSDRTRRNLFRRDTPEGIDAEWHEAVITAIGPRLVHQIDGKVFCDVEDNDPAAPRKGHIVLGNAGQTTVDFKDIQLKRISPPR
jgi:hypothetical protein